METSAIRWFRGRSKCSATNGISTRYAAPPANSALIGHIHTAGTPGRGELDDQQEIHYPAVMRALVESGYRGYVGHEFIPTRDPREGLAQAIAVCDV